MWLHQLHQIAHNPGRKARNLLIKGGRYLKGVLGMPKVFRMNPDIPLGSIRYSSDASLADLPKSRTTGGLWILGRREPSLGPLWKARHHDHGP